MNFRSPYLEWIKALEFPKYNLGMSGLYYTGSIKDLGLKAAEIKVNQPGMYGARCLIEALSARNEVPPENIFITQGTSGVNYLLFKTLFSAGDEVLVETPVYDPLPAALQAVGAIPVFLPRPRVNGFQLDEALIGKLLTPKTKALLITNLHNPTGVSISEDKLQSMANILQERRCWLMVDEVYWEFFFGKDHRTSFHLGDNIIVTSSLTKAFGLGGLRAGWGYAPADVVEKVQKVYNLTVGSGPGITEYIAAKIISNDELYNVFADKARRLMENNLPIVEEFMASQPDLKWVKPDGGIVCFPMLSDSEKVDKLHKTLLQDYQTLIIPGKFFSSPTGFRLGFGAKEEILRQGLKNISKALDAMDFKMTGTGN